MQCTTGFTAKSGDAPSTDLARMSLACLGDTAAPAGKSVGPRWLSNLKPAGGGNGGRKHLSQSGTRCPSGGFWSADQCTYFFDLVDQGLSLWWAIETARKPWGSSSCLCNRRHSVRKSLGPGHCSAKDCILWTGVYAVAFGQKLRQHYDVPDDSGLWWTVLGVSTIYISPVFSGYFSRNCFLQFSHEFSREKVFSRKFLSIFLLDFSRVLSNSLDCFWVHSYLRSLKFLIFGDWRRRNMRKATMMHLPKRCILDKNEFSRENKCSRNFLEKITAT